MSSQYYRIELLEQRLLLAFTPISDMEVSGDSNPGSFTRGNSHLYFIAKNPAEQILLYQMNLEGGNLSAIASYPQGNSSSIPTQVVAAGEKLYLFFSGQQPSLWVSENGAAPSQIFTFPAGVMVDQTRVAGSRLYFTLNEGSGTHLWRSDGVAGSTERLTNDSLSVLYGYPLTVLGSKLVFTAKTSSNGWEPAISDGTTDGTKILGDLNPGTANSTPDYYTALNDRVYFRATSPATGSEIFVTDGTDAGTHLLTDLNPGPGDSQPRSFGKVGGKVVFYAFVAGDWKIVKADANGAVPFASTGGIAGQVLRAPVDLGGRAAMLGTGQAPANSIFATDAALTQFAAYPAPTLNFQSGIQVVGTTGHVTATPNTGLPGVYSVDSQTLSIQLVHSSPSIGSFVSLGDSLTFVSSTFETGLEPWIITNNDPQPRLIADINTSKTTVSISPSWPGFVTLGSSTYFFANNYIFSADGTPAGTRPLLAVGPATQLYPDGAGNRLFFAFTQSMYVTDGTVAGSRQLAKGISNTTSYTSLNGIFYFNSAGALWRSDGTAAGTYRVSNTVTSVSDLVTLNNSLFFLASTAATGVELYRSDGTDIEIVKDIQPGSANSAAVGATINLIVRNGALFFLANDGSNRLTLWQSNGTPAGTMKLFDPDTLEPMQSERMLLQSGSKVLLRTLSASDGEFFLFAIDPVTGAVETIYQNPRLPNVVGVAGDKVYFTTFQSTGINGGPTQSSLWVTDYTAAGTHVVYGFSPSASVISLFELNEVFYFAVQRDFEFYQIMRSDGTTGGTTPVDGSSTVTGPSLPFGTIVNGRPVVNGIQNGSNKVFTFDPGPAPSHGSATLAGRVYSDANRNNIFDAGDTVLDGWTVYIDANASGTLDAGELQVATDGDGYYRFTGLNSGTVQAATRSYANELSAPLARSVTLTSSGVATQDFRTGPQFVASVFNDADGDGIRDYNEPGIAGIKIFIDWNDNGVLDYTEELNTTDSNGRTYLSWVNPQGHLVRQVIQSGWVQTTPASSFGFADVSPAAGEDYREVAFSQRVFATGTAIASGGLFHDLNGDGVKNGEDFDLANRVIYLDQDNDRILDPNEYSTRTNEQGRFYFSNLYAGTYKVRHQLEKGTVQTTPANGNGLNVTLSTGQSKSAGSIGITIERIPPTVVNASFSTETGLAVSYTFSEDVIPGFDGVLGVVELSTNQPVQAVTGFAYDPITHRVTFRMTSQLPNGNYRASILPGYVRDYADNMLTGSSAIEFFSLSGDANRDRKVDSIDFGILLANYGMSARVFSQGDFTFDSKVDTLDFNRLAGEFGNSVLPA